MSEQENKPTGIEAMACADIAKRQAFGLNKYGVSVADNPLELRQWLQHAYEEALDMAIYLRRAIEEIDAAEYKRLACRACEMLHCECDEYE